MNGQWQWSMWSSSAAFAVGALALAPVSGVLAQGLTPSTCLGAALGLGTNCGQPGAAGTVSPITRSGLTVGNPASASSLAVDSFLNNAVGLGTGITTKAGDAPSKEEDKKSTSAAVGGWSRSSIGVGGVLARYKTDGISTRRVSLPISYSIQSDIDPGRKITFRLPITHTSTAGRSGTSLGLGVDYRLPINDAWSLTPAFSYTHVDDDEFASGNGKVWSAGLTSVYNLDVAGGSMSIANMLGHSSVRGLAGGSVNNTVLRNGVMWSRPVAVSDQTLGLQLFFIHTHYTDKDVFQRNYSELGFNLGSGKSAFATKDYWRAGMSFTQSNKTKGVSVNVGYWF